MAEDSSRLEEACALDCVRDCDYEDTSTVTYCGWFCELCSTWSPSHGYDTCQEEQEAVKDHHRKWLVKELKEKLKGLKKVKVLVEILGGPKWKTHIMRRLRTCSGGGAKNRNRRMQFQYDPKSYALNFDDGIEKEGDGVYLDFSARYAFPLGINKEYLGMEARLKDSTSLLALLKATAPSI